MTKDFSIVACLITVVSSSCIDRISINSDGGAGASIIVQGEISDQPGPYTIFLNSDFDTESKLNRIPITGQRVILSDNHGNKELLTEGDKGVYKTATDGMKGTVGSIYKLRIEMSDGRIYESKPDTLIATGKVDSVWSTFRSMPAREYKYRTSSLIDPEIDNYGFDITFNASSESITNKHFLFRFNGTFKVVTNPVCARDVRCSTGIDCDSCNVCNYVIKCSGVRNVGKTPKDIDAVFYQLFPCSCCTCWYEILSDEPILSDVQFGQGGHFRNIRAGSIPIHQWIFQNKIYAQVSQLSLSRQAYIFWKAIRDQKAATNNIFQPVTGKIPSNFDQISGSPAPINGIFFATSISSKTIIIDRSNVPDRTYLFPVPKYICLSCLELFPHSTTVRPPFWKD